MPGTKSARSANLKGSKSKSRPAQHLKRRTEDAQEDDDEMKVFEAEVFAADRALTRPDLHVEVHPVDPKITYSYRIKCNVSDLDTYDDPDDDDGPVWEKAPLQAFDRFQLPRAKKQSEEPDDYDGEWFAVNDVVLVNAEEGSHEVEYAAVIREIRALNRENVFVRLLWFNRHQDLPPALQDEMCYGADELFPTAFMDVVDAKNVLSKLDLVRLGSSESKLRTGGWDGAYWRTSWSTEKLDFFGTPMDEAQKCKCGSPANPEDRIACDRDTCGRVMHERCLVAEAWATVRWPGTSQKAASQTGNSGESQARKGSNRRSSVKNSEFTHACETRDEDQADAGKKPLYIRIHDLRPGFGGKSDLKAECLFCGAQILENVGSGVDDNNDTNME